LFHNKVIYKLINLYFKSAQFLAKPLGTISPMNRRIYIPILFLLCLVQSCATETSESNIQKESVKTITKVEPQENETISLSDSGLYEMFSIDLLNSMPDSFIIDQDNVLNGDFNGDGKNDVASIFTNNENGFQGVIIVHNGTGNFYAFGGGQEINGMTNLDWIDVFRIIPTGEVIAPTLVDSTGDIIGPDKSKEFQLQGDGIYMHVDEACGGGILFWKGNQYEWYHLE